MAWINPTKANLSQFSDKFDLKTKIELKKDTNVTITSNSKFPKQGIQVTYGSVNTESNPGIIPTTNPTNLYISSKTLPNIDLDQFQYISNGGADNIILTTTSDVPLNRFNNRLYFTDQYNQTGASVDKLNTNRDFETVLAEGIGAAAGAVGGGLGLGGFGGLAGNLLSMANPAPTYFTLDYDRLYNIPGISLQDFRSMRFLTGNATKLRLDGTSAAFRKSVKGAIYAGLTIAPTGPYVLFNLNGRGKAGYGWGSHDDRYAIRNDFTMRSNIATRWDAAAKSWKNTINPLDLINEFRGDRVNVIDFGKRGLDDAYKFKPAASDHRKLGALGKLNLDKTQDFIKFFLTGPKLVAGNTTETDDIIVFRATITQLDDRFSPDWVEQKMVGRADKNYTYQGYARELDLNFTVYATDRNEVKPIWRKLNALAGYTAPIYDKDSIAMIAPWLRVTIGDLFVQQPAFISQLSYTLHDTDTTWEINIEDDPEMMQTPHKIEVQLGLTLVTDSIPQHGGTFYSLAKKFDAGIPVAGNDNWLSDFKNKINE